MVVLGMFINFLYGLFKILRPNSICVLVILGLGIYDVSFFRLDDSISPGRDLLAHVLLGNIAKALPLGIDAQNEFAEALRSAVTNWQRAQGERGRRIGTHFQGPSTARPRCYYCDAPDVVDATGFPSNGSYCMSCESSGLVIPFVGASAVLGWSAEFGLSGGSCVGCRRGAVVENDSFVVGLNHRGLAAADAFDRPIAAGQ